MMGFISKCKEFVPNKIYCDACDEIDFFEITSITVAESIFSKSVGIV